jgi:hypothetical protein
MPRERSGVGIAARFHDRRIEQLSVGRFIEQVGGDADGDGSRDADRARDAPPSADSTQYDPQTRQVEKERLLATGVSGKATVTSARATGDVDSEGRPVYDLMLTIEIPARQPMQGPARTGVPADRVDRLEPGDTVAIKADPNNPTVMTIDWAG